MDLSRPAAAPVTPDVIAFVRFCYRRRRVGWPEIYDEMCAVAGRGLFEGWGFDELAEHGVCLTLFDSPRLAALVALIAAEESDHAERPSLERLPARSASADRVAAAPVATGSSGAS